MQYTILATLFAAAQAQMTEVCLPDKPGCTADDVQTPDWQPTTPLTYSSPWKSCTIGDDSTCDADHYCLQHMWSYNGQTESGTGCWSNAVCSGAGAFDMFDGRKLQFFCSRDQTLGASSMGAPWGLTAVNGAPFDKFIVACEADSDCPSPDTQFCTRILWDGTDDGKSYANGVACYTWGPDSDVCPGPEFANLNENYANTGFSHYTQYECTTGAMHLVSAAAATILALMF